MRARVISKPDRGRWTRGDGANNCRLYAVVRSLCEAEGCRWVHIDGFSESVRSSTSMNAQELIEIGQRLYGKRGWQTKMAGALEIDTSTIRRWMYADVVPGPAKVALRCLAREAGIKKRLGR